MNGIEIHDMDPRGFLAFDLRDIAHCLGEEFLRRQWQAEDLECMGPLAYELESLGGAPELVSGSRLKEIADGVTQVIWGTFYGRRPGEDAPSLVIKAIDSTLWEVWGDDATIARVRTCFDVVKRVHGMHE
jgi:hypothetical protein